MRDLRNLAICILVISALVAWSNSPINGDAPLPPTEPTLFEVPDGGAGVWKKAKASWYTGPTDKTADGTKMRLDGKWVATRLVPMGSKIEVRHNGKTWVLPRRDTPSKRYGHRLDLPQQTWQQITGSKLSTGLVEVEWRETR